MQFSFASAGRIIFGFKRIGFETLCRQKIVPPNDNNPVRRRIYALMTTLPVQRNIFPTSAPRLSFR